jgi:hypothetical protein
VERGRLPISRHAIVTAENTAGKFHNIKMLSCHRENTLSRGCGKYRGKNQQENSAESGVGKILQG